jgi:hypothetical protein
VDAIGPELARHRLRKVALPGRWSGPWAL